jgi:putative ABC transport system permease protein
VRIRSVLAEALASARAQRVPSLLVATLVAAMCLSTVLTVGRSAAAQAQVAVRLESAGSRELQIIDARDHQFLTPLVVGQVRSLSTVERAVGLGVPHDVVNAALGRGGAQVTAWTANGDLADLVTLAAGRWPGPGEAMVSVAAQRTLGMAVPVGAVIAENGTVSAVVGSYRVRSPFGDLDGVLVADPTSSAHALRVVAVDAASAPVTQQAVLAVLARADLSELSVTSPVTLADVQSDVAGDLSSFGHGLLLLVLGVGALLVSVVVFADTLVRRSDLGRRRALGATRAFLIVMVVLRTAAAAVAGAVVVLAVTVVLTRAGSLDVPASFVGGTTILAVLAGSAASMPPAVIAAWQDPVRVLRTP